MIGVCLWVSKDSCDAWRASQADARRREAKARASCRRAVCGYKCGEAVGLPGSTAPGTAWADIPDDWTCPDCGSRNADFQLVDVTGWARKRANGSVELAMINNRVAMTAWLSGLALTV